MARETKKKKNDSGCAISAIFVGLVIFSIIVSSIYKSCEAEEKLPVRQDSDGNYQLKFSESFSKGLASLDDLGLSIMIAMDNSGSMDEIPASGGAQKKYLIASESLTEIVNFLSDFYEQGVKDKIKLKVGLMRFSSTPQLLYPITEMNPAEFEKLRQITADPRNFLPDYKTAIGDTLASGIEMLAQSGTIFKSMIIITDGENTEGSEPETVMEAVVNNRNNKNTPDFPVLTSTILVSFVGFDINSSVFEKLHRLGARVTSADNKRELNDSLKKIFMADITKLESK